MRKLKLQVQMSIDGFIGGPQGEMDWVLFNWTEDIQHYVKEITSPVDQIVLGKNLALGFIPHWKAAYENPNGPEPGSEVFATAPKVVFSRTLKESPWENTEISNDLVGKINSLKALPGGDIIAYGGANFVSSLIENHLIDEFHFFINPVILGSGMPIFQQLKTKQALKLVKSQAFECGIVVMVYTPNHEA